MPEMPATDEGHSMTLRKSRKDKRPIPKAMSAVDAAAGDVRKLARDARSALQRIEHEGITVRLPEVFGLVKTIHIAIGDTQAKGSK